MVNVVFFSFGVFLENRNLCSVMVFFGGFFFFCVDVIMMSSFLLVICLNLQLFVFISLMFSFVVNKLLCNVLVIWCVLLVCEVEIIVIFGIFVVGVGVVVSVVGC